MWQRVRSGSTAIVVAALACGLLVGGCSRYLDLEGKAGSVLTGSLGALKKPENREALQALLTSPEIEASTKVVTKAVLDAAWEDLSRDERRARARELTAELVEAAGPALARTLERDVLPKVREELAGSVEAVFEKVLTAENRRKAEDFTTGIAQAVLRSTQEDISRAIAAGVATGIDRGVQRTVETQLGPAVQALDGKSAVFANTLRAGTEGALLGAADALQGELGAVLRQDRQAFLQQLQAVAAAERRAWLDELEKGVKAHEARWKRWFLLLSLGVGVLVVAAGIWLTLLVRENRRLKAV